MHEFTLVLKQECSSLLMGGGLMENTKMGNLMDKGSSLINLGN